VEAWQRGRLPIARMKPAGPRLAHRWRCTQPKFEHRRARSAAASAPARCGPGQRVTIVPHGMALGVTYQRPEDDRHSYSEQYLHARIVGAMGGRAAEEVVFDAHTTGAENDMQQATDLARQMVTRRAGPPSVQLDL
jgi:Peptidase family M41